MKKKDCFDILLSGLLGISIFSIGLTILLCPCVQSVEPQKENSVSFTDWESLYPHNDSTLTVLTDSEKDSIQGEFAQEIDKKQQMKTVKQHLLEGYFALLNCEQVIDTICNDIEPRMFGYSFWREIGGYARCIWASGVPYQSSSLVELDDGYLVQVEGEVYESLQDSFADEMLELKYYLDERDIPLLFVQPPKKICREDDYFPGGLVDWSNKNTDRFLNKLRDRSIDCIDLRTEFHSRDMEHHALFFSTDHHWKITTGFTAAQIIAQAMSEKNIAVDEKMLLGDNYTEEIFHHAMFGSDGHTAGKGNAQSEDFVVLVPDFETSFRVISKDIDVDISGNMQETMINMKNLCSMEGIGGYAYEQILEGNRALTQIINLTSENQTKVLFIKDSFALAVAPYLAQCVGEVDLIDLRENTGHFTGSVKEFIRQEQPDIVIVLQSYPQNVIN